MDADATDEVTRSRSASRVTFLLPLILLAEGEEDDEWATTTAAAAARPRVELAARRLEFANGDGAVSRDEEEDVAAAAGRGGGGGEEDESA